MKCEQEVRNLLVGNTIRLIAEGGFEKATTHAITHSGNPLSGIKMNEAYIYRLFGRKEKLYAIAFSHLDGELVWELCRCLESCPNLQEDTEQKLYAAFLRMWRFVIDHEEHCRCYVRYYYSVYFKDESLEAHKRLFEKIIEVFQPLFKEEADIKSILHSVYTSIFDFAVRVFNGELKDTETNAKHIFNVIYCMMHSYFKEHADVEP